MTSQNQNQANNSADAPQTYGGGDGVQDSGRTDSFRQGQQQEQEKWGTYAGANVASGERQHATYDTSPNTNSPDTFQGTDVPTSHRVGEQSLAGGQSEGPFPDTASGAPGSGGPTQSSTQQTPTPSSFEKAPDTASWDPQPASTGTAAQYDQSDSKVQSGTGTQVGGEQADTGAAVGGEGTGASGAAGTTAPGTEPKGLKNIVSGVHGAGEALRGKMMQGVDEIFGDEEGVEKNREIAEAGMEKMRSGLGVGHGNAPGVGGHRGNQGTASEAREDVENKGTAHQAGGMGLREAR